MEPGWPSTFPVPRVSPGGHLSDMDPAAAHAHSAGPPPTSTNRSVTANALRETGGALRAPAFVNVS